MITAGMTASFKQEILDGIHAPDDDYKMALFTADADLGPETKSYSGQSGEVPKGQGYARGGQSLAGRTTGSTRGTAYMTFGNPRWRSATITAHGALIYNASKDNRSVAVINFGKDHISTNGDYFIEMPEGGVNALITVT